MCKEVYLFDCEEDWGEGWCLGLGLCESKVVSK